MAKKATTTAKTPKVEKPKVEKLVKYPKEIQDRIDYHNSCIKAEVNYYFSLTGQALSNKDTSPVAVEILERIQEHNDSIESIINSN